MCFCKNWDDGGAATHVPEEDSLRLAVLGMDSALREGGRGFRLQPPAQTLGPRQLPSTDGLGFLHASLHSVMLLRVGFPYGTTSAENETIETQLIWLAQAPFVEIRATRKWVGIHTKYKRPLNVPGGMPCCILES